MEHSAHNITDQDMSEYKYLSAKNEDFIVIRSMCLTGNYNLKTSF